MNLQTQRNHISWISGKAECEISLVKGASGNVSGNGPKFDLVTGVRSGNEGAGKRRFVQEHRVSHEWSALKTFFLTNQPFGLA